MSQEFPLSVADIALYDPYINTVCTLCQKILSTDGDPNGDLPAISICGDCKFLLLEDADTPSREPLPSQRRRRRRRNRYSSSESIENLFSQQFSHMINLVRQNQPPAADGPEEPLVEGDSAARMLQRTSARTTPSGSGRWRRIFSDTESEGFDENESIVSFGRQRLFHGESDAVSFTTYGDESDASVDLNGFLDQNEGSDFDSETTDIDPMHAGLDHWNSEEDEVDGEWEEGDDNGEEDATDARTRVRDFLFPGQGEQRPRSPGIEPVWAPEFSDPADYLDARGLDEFLMHLAEEDNRSYLRRGAPPASASFVNSLPRIVIKNEHAKHSGLVCAICKDALAVRTEATQLPCDHLYHPSCISPWLSARNSCPLCRYELPTDDREYEEGKQRHAVVPPIVATEVSSVSFSDREDNNGEEERVAHDASRPVREGGRGRWLFLAAAPIVGLVGIVLVLWLGNLRAEGRGASRNVVLPDHGQRGIGIAGSLSGRRESRGRRWWFF